MEKMTRRTMARRAATGILSIIGPGASPGNAGAAAPRKPADFAPIGVRFELPDVTGNPFDYRVNDVRVTFRRPDGKTTRVPAFFDGGAVWRARYTPPLPGGYALAGVTRNGQTVQPRAVERRAFTAGGRPGSGFVRRDPKNAAGFRFDNGDPYYPLGHNAAWKSGDTPDIPELFAKMGAAGENWSRVWMNHWDNKNLDWVQGARNEPGVYSLEVARRWDSIVDAAARHGIYFQMVLQHHGQYTTRTNPNWDDNPWNAKNGGFLATPQEFFTSERARALTKAKYRYIVARWGHSPHVLAWELFNEVEWTDAIRDKRESTVAAWHREMATFLREQDPNRHLVTTSSDRNIAGLYDAMDYLQPHHYPPDAVTTVTAVRAPEAKRPVFIGEIGPQGDLNEEDGRFLKAALWASLMSDASGAAQYWTWDVVDRKNLYGHFRSAARFLKASGLPSLVGARAVVPAVETQAQGQVAFAPGGGWGAAKQTEFTVPPTGAPAGIGTLPSFLQGDTHRAMFPGGTFHVAFRQPGMCRVTVRQAAKAGAKLVLRVDGAVVAERAFPAADADTAVDVTVEAPVPAGKHAVRIENLGQDWLVIGRIAFTPYGPVLGALARTGPTGGALWIRRTAGETAKAGVTGTVTVPGLKPGAYEVVWWDTQAGAPHSRATASVAAGKPLRLRTPPVTADIAAFVRPAKAGGR
uniref:GH5 / GH5_7 n=1 Tax=uncultured Armatimonadetes bacterium TaxID=157466 RepID=A0A6J4I895_9BACT|nr:GH5 / GH5_7 [uncultured Armatimonadetes bacterium]